MCLFPARGLWTKAWLLPPSDTSLVAPSLCLYLEVFQPRSVDRCPTLSDHFAFSYSTVSLSCPYHWPGILFGPSPDTLPALCAPCFPWVHLPKSLFWFSQSPWTFCCTILVWLYRSITEESMFARYESKAKYSRAHSCMHTSAVLTVEGKTGWIQLSNNIIVWLSRYG